VATDNASCLTTNSAALNGNLTSLGTATSVNVSFQYGTTQGGPYPNTTASQAQSATGAFQINASGLTSRTTYYFRAKADGGINGTAYGDEASFSTGSFPPYVETMPASDITDHTVNLNGKLKLLGSANTVNVYFVYGTTQGGPYPNTTSKQPLTAAGDFQTPVSGLNAGTTYYFRARADGGLYGAGAGSELAFTTSKVPPSVTTNAAGDITSDNATLNGRLDARGDAATVNVCFEWGTIQGGPYQNTTSSQAMTAAGTFNAALSDLDGNTTYYFRAKADGGIYGTAYGSEQNFTTLKVPPEVITDNATSVASTSAILHGFLDSMGTADSVNTWFVYGTTPGSYTESTATQAMQSRASFTPQSPAFRR
jgi:subtilisin